MYFGYFQNRYSYPAYFRQTQDSLHYYFYKYYSSFLPLINNERDHDKKDQYKQRFSALNRLGLIKFEMDMTLYPRESPHFQEIDMNSKL